MRSTSAVARRPRRRASTLIDSAVKPSLIKSGQRQLPTSLWRATRADKHKYRWITQLGTRRATVAQTKGTPHGNPHHSRPVRGQRARSRARLARGVDLDGNESKTNTCDEYVRGDRRLDRRQEGNGLRRNGPAAGPRPHGAPCRSRRVPPDAGRQRMVEQPARVANVLATIRAHHG